MVALNAQTKKKWWLGTPKLNGEEMVALNAQTTRDGGSQRPNLEDIALNTKSETRL